MLTSVLGVLLASLASGPHALASGPHALQPGDVCLTKPCDRPPVYCLAWDTGCEADAGESICFVTDCVPRGPQLPRRLQP